VHFRCRGSVTSYLTGQMQVAKFLLVTAATLLPPLQLASCTENAAIARHVDRQLRLSEAKGTPPTPGDIISVTGQLQAAPLAVPDRLAQFRNALMVVERVEERWGTRRGSWVTKQTYAWVSEFARIGNWRLNADLIQHSGFARYLPSPCYDYRPPRGWTAECGDSAYAIQAGSDGDRRVSYEVTPVTDRSVTLIARVSSSKSALSPISVTWSSDPAPFAFLGLGAQDPHDMLARHVHAQQRGMLAWWFVVLAVALGWMLAALRGDVRQDQSRLAGDALWRATIIASPLLVLFLGFENWIFIPATFVAVSVSAIFGLQFWRIAHGQLLW
jgi:hypothetical protein